MNVRRSLSLGAALVLATALAACESTKSMAPGLFSTGPAVGGQIVPLGGSTARGFIAVQRRQDAGTMVVNLNAVPPGAYRVVFHANGNCRSNNGFSAGPPWAPEGGEVKAYVGSMTAEGLLSMSVVISPLVFDGPDGIVDRSVVVHYGLTGTLDAEPGVRNDRIACVVLNPMSGPEW